MTGNPKFQTDFLNFRFQKSNFCTDIFKIIYKNLSATKIGLPEMFQKKVFQLEHLTNSYSSTHQGESSYKILDF